MSTSDDVPELLITIESESYAERLAANRLIKKALMRLRPQTHGRDELRVLDALLRPLLRLG